MDQTQPKFIGFQGLFMYLNAFYQGDFLQLEVWHNHLSYLNHFRQAFFLVC